MGCRKNGDMFHPAFYFSRQHVDAGNAVDLIPKEFHPKGIIPGICRKDLQHIPVYPEGASVKIHFATVILNVNELTDHFVPILFHTRPQRYHHFFKVLRFPKAINTGNAGDDDHVPAFDQRSCSGQSQFIYLIIHGRVLCNISIGRRHISLRLIIVIIRHKIFHRIFRKEFLKFSVQLGCQSFVMRQNQGGFIQLLNHICHGKSLAGTSDSQ